ncbi:hypothetical protein PHSC3_001790 [Chlamydiales bacterium STE3]|nr:hypothetical protein PHSC3_001790 [Chlamydiales bacterium STE3]
MKSIFFSLCLMTTTLFADHALMNQYHLPDLSQSWTIGNQVENEKGTTLIYIPQGTTQQTAKEFFGLSIGNAKKDIQDTSSFKKGLIQMLPKMNIDFWVIEKGTNSILYEWSAKDEEGEKAHGWGRSFNTDEGNVVIGYFTENIHDVNRARSVWLPILKAANP